MCLRTSKKSFPRLFLLNFHLRVFVYLHREKPGKGQRLDKPGRQTDEHAKMWPRERKAMLKTREDKRQRELGRWRKWRETGPWPDHTDTLGAVSPCQLCTVVDSERTHSHTHILIYACWRWGHTWPVCMCVPVCVFECVFECDSLSMRAKESVDATKNPAVCVCFASSLCAFVFMSLNLYAHLCVYTYIYTSAGVCWCPFPSVFLAQHHEQAGYWCAVRLHVPLHHLSLFAASPHVRHVCEPLAMSSTNGVIRYKCSKVQHLDPATPQRSLPTMLCRILRPTFPPLEPDCYPTRTSPQIEMVLLTGNVGTLCFQSGPRRVLTGPRKGLFLPCVESCWIGRRETCRKCNMVKESNRGKFPLNTAVCRVCVSLWVCAVHMLMFMCVCGCVCVHYTVTKCGWAFTVCARCV